ncbi:hypothetical protein BC567DRAFT_25746 [Phyllosticta citribraziliensis]
MGSSRRGSSVVGPHPVFSLRHYLHSTPTYAYHRRTTATPLRLTSTSHASSSHVLFIPLAVSRTDQNRTLASLTIMAPQISTASVFAPWHACFASHRFDEWVSVSLLFAFCLLLFAFSALRPSVWLLFFDSPSICHSRHRRRRRRRRIRHG